MNRKARITIEIECSAPEGFFEMCWEDIPQELQEEIEEHGPIPCEGSGEITTLCVEYDCRWAKYDDWDSELL